MSDPQEAKAHTPTPWRVERRKTGSVAGTWLIAGPQVADFPVDRYGIFKEADAAFIVRACNSHEELLTALEGLEKFSAVELEPADSEPNVGAVAEIRQLLAAARSALRRAKGESDA